VLDYAWSADSGALAVALSGIDGVQDYLSGVSLAALSQPWPLMAREQRLDISPLVYRSELRWVGPRDVVLSIADPFSSEQLPAVATLTEDATRFDHVNGEFSLAGGQFGYLPAASGFWLLNGQNAGTHYYELADSAQPLVALSAGPDPALGPWLSPTGTHVAKTTADARLQIFDLTDHLLSQTQPGECGSVIAWVSAPGRERLACAALDTSGPVSQHLRIADYNTASNELTLALVPELGRAVPLGGTQRLLSANGERLLFLDSNNLLSVDLSSAQPRILSDKLVLGTPARLDFVGNHLLAHHGAALTLYDLDDFLAKRDLAGVEAGATMAPAIACQEGFSLAPQEWCGAPSASGRSVSSADSRAILFEDVAGALWIADTQSRAAARQVAADLRSCSAVSRPGWTTPCAKAYAFQP
jgi:hypothetical protein